MALILCFKLSFLH